MHAFTTWVNLMLQRFFTIVSMAIYTSHKTVFIKILSKSYKNLLNVHIPNTVLLHRVVFFFYRNPDLLMHSLEHVVIINTIIPIKLLLG